MEFRLHIICWMPSLTFRKESRQQIFLSWKDLVKNRSLETGTEFIHPKYYVHLCICKIENVVLSCNTLFLPIKNSIQICINWKYYAFPKKVLLLSLFLHTESIISLTWLCINTNGYSANFCFIILIKRTY